jgi:predicted nucleotidyltransferase
MDENNNTNLEIEKIKNDIIKIADEHKVVSSILIRGSYSNQDFDSESADIDLSFILSEGYSFSDIIEIKRKIKNLIRIYGIEISATFQDFRGIISDSKIGIHFHGRKSAAYSHEIEGSMLLYGSDVRSIFSDFRKYSILDMYRNACDLISIFIKGIFNNPKKGMNFSFILAKECLICKNYFIYRKGDIIKNFKENINNEFGIKLEEIKKLRKKEVLKIEDLSKIYEFLIYCKNFIFQNINPSNLGEIKKIEYG